MGEQVWPKPRQSRNSAGQYKRGSAMAKVLATIALVVFAFVGSYFLFGAAGQQMADATVDWIADQIAPTVHAENYVDPKALAKSMLGKSIDGLKDAVVADIEQCESQGDYGIIVFDSNNEASIAGMQFQRKTVIHYVEKFEGKTITRQDAIEVAVHKETARALAKRIIFEEDAWQGKDGAWHGSWANWLNCSKDLNVRARVDAIKSLSI